MKNTLKKVLCTALAAVSLSAMVTVPSSLNKPNSDNAIVNVVEADATEKVEQPLYTGYITPSDKNKYNVRKVPKDGNKYIYKNLQEITERETIWAYKPVNVYEIASDGKYTYARISSKEQIKKTGRPLWVRKSRIKAADKSLWSVCSKVHGNKQRAGYIEPDYLYKKNGVTRIQWICPYCGRVYWD